MTSSGRSAPPQLKDVPSRKRAYAAPRKFDMATLFVITIVYSCLLGAMTALGWNQFVILGILAYFTMIGVAQAVLFRGNRPRLASLIAGGAIPPLGVIATVIILNNDVNQINVGSFETGVVFWCSILFGAILGYVSGAMIGGVFLVADFLRGGRGVIN